jgi:hypothetical protein
MIYFVLRLWRLDDAVREKTLGLRLSTKQGKAIEEIWTIGSKDIASCWILPMIWNALT